MNILYFFEYAPNPQRGGASRLTHSLVSYWRNNNKNYSFFCAYFKKEIDYLPYFEDEILVRITDKTTFGNFLRKNNISIVIFQMGFSKEYFNYVKDCCQNHIPIITVFHSMPGWETIHIKSLIKSLPWHTATFTDKIKKTFLPFYLKHINNLIRKKNQYIYNLSTKYVVLSDSYISLFQKKYHIKNGSKLFAISNPLSYPEQTKIEYSKKKNQVLIVSRFSESEKRILFALKAWKKIQQHIINNKWELIIVGFGKDESLYRDYVKLNKLQNVIFTGKQEPFKYYKESSIFLMTSAFEGFVLTLTESQQMGVVPIVMDSFPSLHDIVINGYNGIIVANNDVTSMAEALKDLIINENKRINLSINGFNYIKKFSVANIAYKWEQLFNEFE